MNLNYLRVCVAVTAAVLFTSVSARASEATDVRQVTGEIGWIDTKLGKLQLKSAASQGRAETTEYRITQDETRVTDPLDKKFLSIEDLQPGQHVTIDVVKGDDENVVRKIIADPRPQSDFQEATGEIEAIDVQAGTLIIEQKPLSSAAGKGDLSYFVFEPKDIVARQNLSQLKPGDLVNVEYVVSDGKRRAHSITLYPRKVMRTTTTTTVTTTR